jgi:hypothetical protein
MRGDKNVSYTSGIWTAYIKIFLKKTTGCEIQLKVWVFGGGGIVIGVVEQTILEDTKEEQDAWWSEYRV